MKKTSFLLGLISSLVLVIAGFVFIFGCGSTTTGGGGGLPTNGSDAFLLGNNVITESNAGSAGVNTSTALPTRTITGSVRKTNSGAGIGAAIVLANSNSGYVTVETSSDGSYSLAGVRVGSVTVSVAKSGYCPMTVACDADRVYFTLHESPAPVAPDSVIQTESYHWSGSTSVESERNSINYFVRQGSTVIGSGGPDETDGNQNDISVQSNALVTFIVTERGWGSSDPVYATLSAGDVRTLEVFMKTAKGTVTCALNPPAGLDDPDWRRANIKKSFPPYYDLMVGEGSPEGAGLSFSIVAPAGSDYFLEAGCGTEEGDNLYLTSSRVNKKIASISNGGTIPLGTYNLIDVPTLVDPPTDTLTPTLEWSSTATDPLYIVVVQPNGSPGSPWICLTNNTSVEYPPFPAGYGAGLSNTTDYWFVVWPIQIGTGTAVNINNFDFANMNYDLMYSSENSKGFTVSIK